MLKNISNTKSAYQFGLTRPLSSYLVLTSRYGPVNHEYNWAQSSESYLGIQIYQLIMHACMHSNHMVSTVPGTKETNWTNLKYSNICSYWVRAWGGWKGVKDKNDHSRDESKQRWGLSTTAALVQKSLILSESYASHKVIDFHLNLNILACKMGTIPPSQGGMVWEDVWVDIFRWVDAFKRWPWTPSLTMISAPTSW